MAKVRFNNLSCFPQMGFRKKERFNNFSCFPHLGFQKKGQVFSLMFVFITLFMCIISSVYIYGIQQGNAESSLISPLVVLQVRDNLAIFEMREKELIEKSLEDVSEEFGSDDFLDKFRNNFIEGIDSEMKDFIFEDLMRNGELLDSAEFDEDSFFRNVLYSKIESSSDGLKFVRSKIGKSISLSASNEVKTNFPVDFLFEFEREYLISFENNEFKFKT